MIVRNAEGYEAGRSAHTLVGAVGTLSSNDVAAGATTCSFPNEHTENWSGKEKSGFTFCCCAGDHLFRRQVLEVLYSWNSHAAPSGLFDDGM